MDKKKFSLSALFDKKGFVLIFSLVVAVLCWAVVSFVISDEFTTTIRDVPITFSSTALDNLGLSVIEKSDETVNVRVTGRRSEVAKLGPDDILVTPNLSGITQSGTYDVSLTASRSSNASISFTINSLSKTSVTLRLDFPETLRMKVEPEIEMPSVPEGYMLGTVTVSPGEINIVGPKDEVAEVARAVVRYTFTGDIFETQTLLCDIVLLDGGGNEINNSNLTLEAEQAEVTIPVLKRATLALEVGFINVPEGFDISTLEYTLSHESIEIAAPEQAVDQLTPKVVGYIDLTDFSLGETREFEIKLPNGYLNIDNVNSVTVAFSSEGLSTRKIRVTNIQLDNVPANYTVEIETTAISDVTIIGPEGEVSALLASSVVAIVDMSQISVSNGEYRVPVSFVIPASNSVWVAGSYEVLISVTPS